MYCHENKFLPSNYYVNDQKSILQIITVKCFTQRNIIIIYLPKDQKIAELHSQNRVICLYIPYNLVNTTWAQDQNQDKGPGQRTNLMGLYSDGGLYTEGACCIREEKHFNLQFVKLITFLSFIQQKARISAYLTSLKYAKLTGFHGIYSCV